MEYRIQRAKWLIQEKRLGVRREGSRQAHALLHSAGQFGWIVIRPFAQLNAVKPDARYGITRAACHSPDLQAKGDIIDDRAVWKQAGAALEHHSNPRCTQALQVASQHAVKRLPRHRYPTMARINQSVHMPYQR